MDNKTFGLAFGQEQANIGTHEQEESHHLATLGSHAFAFSVGE